MNSKISILIPTLNAQNVLETCLQSIAQQNYPKELIEIIIADGGSTDKTLEIARKYGATIVANPLKTAEAGKKVALNQSTGEFIALIDSDNILPHSEWLKNMLEPLYNEPTALGSEPWAYTWRKEDGFISRYCALIGMNDPFVNFLGNYDRLNLLTNKWTETPHKETDNKTYILATFDKRGIPTIGANGTIFRADFLKQNAVGNYLFDIDILAKYLHDHGIVTFIKVKESIIHTYCESDILKFARKQRRRVMDFLYHKSLNDRAYDWQKGNNLDLIKFILYCVTIVPLVIQSLIGFVRKPDPAWFFHPLACEFTLWEYGTGVIRGLFNKSEANRDTWKQ